MARAALPATGQKVAKLIMLGTPNYGSFAPVQVLRGTYDVVQKILKVDRTHTADELCGQVFNTFPSLYEMMPSPDKFSTVNLYKPDTWPSSGPQPRKDRLAAVKSLVRRLAPADDRFYLIAGVNRDTVTGLHKQGDGEFAYEISTDGDGTVPLEFARLADIKESQIYYVEEGHGNLPNNGSVESAVTELLSTGATKALSMKRPAAKRSAAVLTERELKEQVQRAMAAGEMGSADYRHLLDAVAAPPRVDERFGTTAAVATVPAGGPADAGWLATQFRSLTIGRQRQRCIELTLAHGGITEVDSRAYLLGIFRNVAPSGAAQALDERLDGAVTEFTARRMFNGEVGTIFTMPVAQPGGRRYGVVRWPGSLRPVQQRRAATGRGERDSPACAQPRGRFRHHSDRCPQRPEHHLRARESACRVLAGIEGRRSVQPLPRNHPLRNRCRAFRRTVLAGRNAVVRIKSPDWADYILYGNADFVLKYSAKVSV